MVYYLYSYPAYDFTLLVTDRHSLGVQLITSLKSNLGLCTDFTRLETAENYRTMGTRKI